MEGLDEFAARKTFSFFLGGAVGATIGAADNYRAYRKQEDPFLTELSNRKIAAYSVAIAVPGTASLELLEDELMPKPQGNDLVYELPIDYTLYAAGVYTGIKLTCFGARNVEYKCDKIMGDEEESAEELLEE